MRSFLVLPLLALALPAISQSMPEVDAFVQKEVARQNAAGVSIAIVRDGKIVYAKGYGFADLEHRVPAKPETVYELGSITKQFTATLVMMLVQEGKLKLNESARTYLPELPEAWKGVTLSHLLTHTSGIKPYTEMDKFGELAREPGTPKAFLDIVGPAPVDFKPGESWKYNNSGYYLLGMLIEKIEGKPYREVLHKRILDPLGMNHTDVNDPADVVPNRARGYVLQGGKSTNAEYVDMGWPYAAGAMVSTVEDMAKWDAALYGESLLKQATLKQMWTPVKLNDGSTYPYGFGWKLGAANGTPLVEHGGAIPGFMSMISRYPEKKLTVVVLANSMPFAEAAMAHAIATIVDPSLKLAVTKIKDTDEKLTAFHRTVVEDMIAGTLKKEIFTEKMQEALFPDQAENAHRGLSAQGKLTTFELIEDKSEQGHRTRTYHVVIGALEAKAIFVTDAAGKIAGLRLAPA